MCSAVSENACLPMLTSSTLPLTFCGCMPAVAPAAPATTIASAHTHAATARLHRVMRRPPLLSRSVRRHGLPLTLGTHRRLRAKRSRTSPAALAEARPRLAHVYEG